jgi:proliferating cell nuclear antigen
MKQYKDRYGYFSIQFFVQCCPCSKATYSLDYLTKITKAVSGAGGSIAAEYSTKMPLRLEFRMANVGRIHFYLAPRVQD